MILIYMHVKRYTAIKYLKFNLCPFSWYSLNRVRPGVGEWEGMGGTKITCQECRKAGGMHDIWKSPGTVCSCMISPVMLVMQTTVYTRYL
jgi:hypothetical protein